MCKMFGIVILMALVASASAAQTPGLDDLAAQLGSRLAERNTKTITVLPFTNDQGYPSAFSSYVVDRLNRMLASQGRGFRIVTRSQSESMLRELGVQYPAEVGVQILQALASRLSADGLVAGSFIVSGDTITLDALLLDSQTTNMVWGHSVRIDKIAVAEILGVPNFPQYGSGVAGATSNPIISMNTSRVAIPAGTVVRVRIHETLSSDRTPVSYDVRASLAADISVPGLTVASRGSITKVKVIERSDHLLKLQLSYVYVVTNQFVEVNATVAEQRGTVSKNKVLGTLLNKGTLNLGPDPATIPAESVIQFRTTADVLWP